LTFSDIDYVCEQLWSFCISHVTDVIHILDFCILLFNQSQLAAARQRHGSQSVFPRNQFMARYDHILEDSVEQSIVRQVQEGSERIDTPVMVQHHEENAPILEPVSQHTSLPPPPMHVMNVENDDPQHETSPGEHQKQSNILDELIVETYEDA